MERFRKAAVLLLAILIILSSCATTEEESYPSVSGTIVSISKYGNAMTSITSEEMKAADYQTGDLIAITVGDYSAIVPLGTNYSDVDRSSAVAVDDGNAIELAINYGDFSSVSGCSEGTAVTVSMAEKGGYSEEFMIRHLVRTENRDDYASDAVFANFREVTVGNIKSGVLYRSCSPVRGDARAPYADALMGEAGIKTVINLADSEESMSEELAIAPNYAVLYENGSVICLNMGVDFFAPDFTAKLHDALIFMIENPGPYLIHCNEGKDRAGMVTATLEAISGATMDEIVADYMTSYENYYGTEKGTEQYDAIANIIRDFFTDMNGKPFPAASVGTVAEVYLENTVGLEKAQIEALKAILTE